MGVLSLGGGKCWIVSSAVEEVGVKVLGWGEVVKLSFLWWLLVLLKSEMSRKVSVMSVVNIISSIAELIWVVESIELISRSLDVVLNTITIEVIDLSLTVKVLLGLELEEGDILLSNLNDNPVIILTIIVPRVWVFPLVTLVGWLLSGEDFIVSFSVISLGWAFRLSVLKVNSGSLPKKGNNSRGIDEFHYTKIL